MPQVGIMDIDWFTILATLINTLLLFLILKHFLYNPVKKMLDARKNEVEGTYKAADDANAQASKLKTEYEKQMETAKEQAGDIVKNATRKANERAEEIVSDAGLKANALMQRAEAEIDMEKKKAMSEIKDQITDIAFMAAEHVVKKELDDEADEKLIESFIENAGDIQWRK